MMVVGMILAFFSISIHLNMFGNYILNPFFSLDYWVFTIALKFIKLPLSTLARLMNIGITLYLLAVSLFVYDFIQTSGSIFKGIVVLIALVLYNLFFYDPVHAYRIYLIGNTSANSESYIKLISALHQINRVWIFVYLFYPVFILYRYQAKNTIPFIKRQIFLLACCLGAVNILFFSIFFIGPFMMSPGKAATTGFWIFENIRLVYGSFYLIVLATAAVLLLIALPLLLNYRLGSLVHLFVDRKINRNISLMNEVLSDTLHSEKNLLFSIQILAGQGIQSYSGGGDTMQNLMKIRELATSSLNRTSETLDAIRDLRYQFQENSLIAALDDAITKANLGEDITVQWDKGKCDQRLGKCRFDYYHINQVLINLLNNAAEAIRSADRNNGIILIDMAVQFQWIFIIIHDNGIGIKKANLKNIFKPYYSNKSMPGHWGLGLSYAYKVVKSHWGQLRVESKWEEGTSVQVIIPFRIERRN
jgi:signal transduction histidine kinase